MLFSLSIWLAALPLAFAAPQSATSSTACNNSPDLCSRSYANITHLGAHDSPFVANSTNKFTVSGNQFFSSTDQLDAGVRLLTAQIHTANDSDTTTPLRLCHSDCSLYDAGTLVDWLSSIKTWMDNNPNDVVTILLVNSINVDATRLDTDFQQAGISKYGYAGPGSAATSQWPTLQTLITANTRLVTFIADLPTNTAAPYLLDEFTYVFENNFEVTSANNFTCTPNRPSTLNGNAATAASSGRLFLMNHFLDSSSLFGIETPDTNAASDTNSADPTVAGSLGGSAAQCTALYGHAPAFVLVDWFNAGPAIATVDSLNGVTGSIIGRKSVSTAILSEQSNGAAGVASRQSVLALAVALAVVVNSLA